MIHVLLPAYNESAALPPVINGIAHALASGDYRIWVVDDGSSDDTQRVLSEIRAAVPLTVLKHEMNRGLGAALRTGTSAILKELRPGDTVVTLDSDNTQPPQIIPHLLTPIENGTADVAIASRFVPGGKMVGVPLVRRLTSHGARFALGALFPIPGVRDYTCGFRAVSGAFLRRATEKWGELFSDSGFSSVGESLLKMSFLNPRVVEVPLVLRYDRKPTQSKMPVARNIIQLLRVVFKYRRMRPA